MPNFAGSKTQRVNKYAGLRAPQTPQPGLHPGLHCKTTLCFSASTCRQDGHARHPRQPANFFTVTASQRLSVLILYRALHFPVVITRQPATALRRISFHTSPHNLPLARNLHSGLTGQYIPSLILSLSFFLPFHSTQKKGNRQSRFPSLSLIIPNLVQI